jgi:hypothetical protein
LLNPLTGNPRKVLIRGWLDTAARKLLELPKGTQKLQTQVKLYHVSKRFTTAEPARAAPYSAVPSPL